jgi:hypothetical protein
VGVQQRGDGVGVGQDPGDVGRGGKAPDAQRPGCVPVQLRGQIGQVDMPVGVGADDHDVGDGLPPGQLVGVMLIRPHEHHRPLPGRDLVEQPVAPRGPVGQAQFQDADQLADSSRGAGPAEDHQVLVGAADRVVDDLPGLFPQPPGRQARAGTFGMGVGVAGQHLIADEVLDEVKGAARGGVVRVRDAPRPIRAIQHLALANDPGPDPLHQRHTRPHGPRLTRPDGHEAPPVACSGQHPFTAGRW